MGCTWNFLVEYINVYTTNSMLVQHMVEHLLITTWIISLDLIRHACSINRALVIYNCDYCGVITA